MIGTWIRRPTGSLTTVFLHGILSDGDLCWRHANGTYWPDLLKHETRLSSIGIYVFEYKTGFFSGTYRLGDVVDALRDQMRLDEVQNSKQIVFVCHSMGGIIARRFLVQHQFDLTEAKKEIGLFLIASPALGSHYANWLSPIARVFHHTQADALRFSQDNAWLMDLDRDFLALKEKGRIHLRGKELVEDQFIVFHRFMRRQIVEPIAGERYFYEALKVPNSDHFSIAKIPSADAIQHRLLVEFIADFSVPSTPKAAAQAKASYDYRSSIAGTLFDVFLSHNGKEKAETIKIGELLRSRALRVWLDIWELRPGLSWQQRIAEGLANSRACAVIIGRSGYGSWHKREMEAALARQGSEYPVIPVLIPGASDRVDVGAFLSLLTWVDMRRGTTDGEAIERLIWGITGLRPDENPNLSPGSSAVLQTDQPGTFHISSPRNGDLLIGTTLFSGTGPKEEDIFLHFRPSSLDEFVLVSVSTTDEYGRWTMPGPGDQFGNWRFGSSPCEVYVAGAQNVGASQPITISYRDSGPVNKIAGYLGGSDHSIEISYELSGAMTRSW